SYPRDWTAHNQLAQVFASDGQLEKAVAVERDALRLEPNNRIAFSNLVEFLLAAGRFDEVRKTLEDALARKFGDGSVWRGYLYTLSFLERNAGGMAEQVAW